MGSEGGRLHEPGEIAEELDLAPAVRLREAVEEHTPTSCSWLNAVETFFAKLAKRRLRRGSFHSLVALQEAINRFVAEHNEHPKPFVWTADPEAIAEKVRRGYHALASIGRQTG